MKEEEDDIDLDLEDSPGMNENQQALFLNIRTKSNDSLMGKLLPQAGDGPERSLVWEMTSHFTNNILIPQTRSIAGRDHQPDLEPRITPSSIHIFKKVKKQKVRSRCDYDKNICGYITKKVIRQFVSRNYEEEVMQLVRKYHSNYSDCKGYYLKKVELVTGPSHLPELFDSHPNQPEATRNIKKVFRTFYRWFLRERYLRYLLLEGKMSNKLAYIEYKNNHLFKCVGQDLEEELPVHMQTRSKSHVKQQALQNKQQEQAQQGESDKQQRQEEG